MAKKRLNMYYAYTPYLYLFPALLIMIIFVFLPLIQAFIYSFQDYNVITRPRWIGFKNYEGLLKDHVFYKSLANTVIYFAGVVPVLIILPLFMGILVNKKIAGIKFFRAAFYLPVVTSMVVAGITWKWIYADTGILNHFLQNILRVTKEPIYWLSSPDTALYSVMAVTVWKGLGYYMVIYLAGLQAISTDIWEAALIDGATGLKKHLRITIPLLAPSMAVVAIMSSMAAMKVFDEIYVMTGGGPFNSSKTVVYHLYEAAFYNLRMGYASAIGFVLFAILIIFSLISIKISENNYEV